MSSVEKICGSIGPRIGGEGCPTCVLVPGHVGEHRAHESWARSRGARMTWFNAAIAEATETICSCGNRYDGDNLCDRTACQWEDLEGTVENDAAPKLAPQGAQRAAKVFYDPDTGALTVQMDASDDEPPAEFWIKSVLVQLVYPEGSPNWGERRFTQ